MDMSVVTVCTTPSTVTKVIVVLLLLYPFALIGFHGWRRRRHTLASAVVPVALIPMFVGACGSLLSIGHVIEGASLSGGGRAARAAGVAGLRRAHSHRLDGVDGGQRSDLLAEFLDRRDQRLRAAAEALYTLVWLIAVRFRDVGLLPRFPLRAALAGIAMRAW